jgi:hypothetical protein
MIILMQDGHFFSDASKREEGQNAFGAYPA